MRPRFWNKLRVDLQKRWRAMRPLERHRFTLSVWFESGVYNEIDMDDLNLMIAKAIQTLPQVGYGARLVTQLEDLTTGCKTGQGKV